MHGLLRSGRCRVSREDVLDFAGAKKLPDPVVQAGEQQLPAITFKRYVGADEDAESAGVDIADAAHVDDQGGGFVLTRGIAKTRGRLRIQHTFEDHDLLAMARTIVNLD